MSETDTPTVTITSAEPTVTITTPDPQPEKKRRAPRPYWLLLPVKGSQQFDVHRCQGKPAVRKLLKDLEIDATDERVQGMKLLRADEIPLILDTQTIFKFGSAADDEDDCEVI